MSPRELAWRLAWPVRTRLVRRPLRLPDWGEPGWAALLERLGGSSPPGVSAAAARIAEGELCFWGRAVRVDPLRPPWGSDPLAGDREAPRVADPKRSWELHRQQHLVPLALAAAREQRADWARVCIAQLRSWVAAAPPGGGDGWSSGYEAAHRLIGWAWAVPLVAATASADELDELARSYALQVRLVERTPSRFSSANNHRIVELVGLLAAETLTGRARWESTWRELEDEVALQTFPDGGSREQASGYFLYVLEALWVAALFARASGRSLGRLEERLQAMLDWLARTAGADGEPPSFGDDAEDRALRLDYFEARRADLIAGRVRSLLDGEPSLAPAPPRRDGGSCLLESGYAILRARRGSAAARAVFDVGDLGYGSIAAHGHADALSVTLDLGGTPVLLDPGTGSYLPSEGRDEYRVSSAHNTVVVDGRSQAEPLGPHLWGRRFTTSVEAATFTDELEYVRASHDGYRPRALHVRSLLFVKPDLLLVLDRVTARAEVGARLAWHLPAGASPERLGSSGAGMAVAAVPPAEAGAGDAPLSTRYGRRAQARRCTWEARGAEVVFATAVSFASPRPPAVRLTVSGDGAATLVLSGRHPLTVVESWRERLPAVSRRDC
jgi:hypothetical protein